jgi:hypothetical protein
LNRRNADVSGARFGGVHGWAKLRPAAARRAAQTPMSATPTDYSDPVDVRRFERLEPDARTRDETLRLRAVAESARERGLLDHPRVEQLKFTARKM